MARFLYIYWFLGSHSEGKHLICTTFSMPVVQKMVVWVMMFWYLLFFEQNVCFYGYLWSCLISTMFFWKLFVCKMFILWWYMVKVWYRCFSFFFSKLIVWPIRLSPALSQQSQPNPLLYFKIIVLPSVGAAHRGADTNNSST